MHTAHPSHKSRRTPIRSEEGRSEGARHDLSGGGDGHMHAVGLDEGFPEMPAVEVEKVYGGRISWDWEKLGQ